MQIANKHIGNQTFSEKGLAMPYFFGMTTTFTTTITG
ncbi:hypothetical protein SAMN05421761_11572 [Belliella pelovolcani]|uniref:Uncharacterized protein n=1 Tax=Belliella pelovolcani TaxID=529505 RepID=A0A1N7PD04_9BACT|nr:hypothetical protein SAMN05421761_11572 [Belliella pelovolcani]